MKLRVFLIASLLVIIVAGMIISQKLAQPITPNSTADSTAATPNNVATTTSSLRPIAAVPSTVSTNELANPPTIDASNSVQAMDEFEARRLRMAALREWASTNFDAALASVQQMQDGDEKNDALEALCFGLAQRDPSLAMTKA